MRIIISGYTDSQDIIAGINEAGIYQYILKPWSPDHLLESVRNAMEAQALQQQTSRLDLSCAPAHGCCASAPPARWPRHAAISASSAS